MTLSDVCSVHGARGCFDCIVGGSSPAYTPRDSRGRETPAGRKAGLAVAGYIALLERGQKTAAPARPLYDRDGALDDEAYAFDGYAAADARAEEAAERAAELRPVVVPFYAMTDRQRVYLSDLIRQRGDALHRELDLDEVDRYVASRLIDELRVRPVVAPARLSGTITLAAGSAPAPALPTVADGRYAVELDGAVRFYRLNTHDRSGRQYLDAQASDDFHAVTLYATRVRVLTAIAADAAGAMRRYGVELGRCGNCGRTLTDETSRAYGIGPDCRAKIGGAV